MKLFIGCSSSETIPEKYTNDCTKLLEILLKDNDLVFGAYNKGLMGIAYNIAKKNKKSVTGICSEFYIESFKDLECDKEEITVNMLDSTMKIYKDSDAMVLLPGGFGTIYEFFTANYSKICKEIQIPIILYNSCGFFDKLLDFIDDVCKENFVKESEKGKFIVANTIEEVISYLNKEG